VGERTIPRGPQKFQVGPINFVSGGLGVIDVEEVNILVMIIAAILNTLKNKVNKHKIYFYNWKL
jgi:hypothetical protein